MLDASTVTVSDSFTEMFDEVRRRGLMRTRPFSYGARIAALLLAYGAGWAALIAFGDTWLTLLVAAALGIVFTQVLFVGHDAGHHQISSSRRLNHLVGLAAGDVLTGLSFGWWVPKHGAHHARPNQVDHDPDIGAGAIAFTAEAAARRRGLGRIAVRLQAWSFFPLLTLEGVNLHVSSFRSLIARRDKGRGLEAALIGGHLVAYLSVVSWVLPPGKAIAFIAVQQGVFGLYLGCAFAPNHKGMPTIGSGTRLSFVERQVLTARNVNGGPVVTFLLGGLDFQIEHHLFPRMPRANLRRCQPIVRAFCEAHHLPYRETGLIDSYRCALGHLSSIGRGEADPALPASVILR